MRFWNAMAGKIVAMVAPPLLATDASVLQLGKPLTAHTSADTLYKFEVRSPGVLTLAAEGTGDLFLEVLDEDKQIVYDGRIDVDHGGNPGLEVGTVILARVGSYLLRVNKNDHAHPERFTLSSSYIPFPAFERSPDPAGRPSLAIPIAIGQSRENRINAQAGDLRDWYIIKAPGAGIVTVAIRGKDGDLVLDAYLDKDFSTPVQTSDQDQEDNPANESVSVTVRAGQVLHARVSEHWDSMTPTPYRISVGFMP